VDRVRAMQERLRKHVADKMLAWNSLDEAADMLGELLEENERLRKVLTEAEEFVDRHSESWYISGQALLAEIRAALEPSK
jgi:hypothetical protein